MQSKQTTASSYLIATREKYPNLSASQSSVEKAHYLTKCTQTQCNLFE